MSAVAREVGIEGDIEKAALVLGVDLGQASHGLLAQPAVIDQAEAAGLLGHEHVAIREEGQAPRLLEAAGDLGDAEGGGLGLDRPFEAGSAWAQVALARAARRVVAGRRILDLPDKLGRYGRSCFSPTRGQPGQPVTAGPVDACIRLCGKSLKVRKPFCSRERTQRLSGSARLRMPGDLDAGTAHDPASGPTEIRP